MLDLGNILFGRPLGFFDLLFCPFFRSLSLLVD